MRAGTQLLHAVYVLTLTLMCGCVMSAQWSEGDIHISIQRWPPSTLSPATSSEPYVNVSWDAPIYPGKEGGEFHGKMEFGTPGQLVDVVFDTGSSNLWVSESGCKDCPGDMRYDPSKSGTYESNGTALNITYGGGQVFGSLVQDTVAIAGTNLTGVTFLSVTKAVSQPVCPPASGLFGLAYAGIAKGGVTPFLETMFKRGMLETHSFGLWLGNGESDEDGMLSLGGVDESLFLPPLVYTPIVEEKWFVITTGELTVGSTAVEANTTGIVDSGTSCLKGPKESIDLILSNISVGTYCDGLDSAPVIHLQIGAARWALTPTDYVVQSYGMCQVCIEPVVPPKHAKWDWVYGEVFFRSHYFHFDMGRKEIGIAEAVYSDRIQSGD